jgi:hypothetical protein
MGDEGRAGPLDTAYCGTCGGLRPISDLSTGGVVTENGWRAVATKSLAKLDCGHDVYVVTPLESA